MIQVQYKRNTVQQLIIFFRTTQILRLSIPDNIAGMGI